MSGPNEELKKLRKKLAVITPVASAVAENSRTTALFVAPAAARMSKLSRTSVAFKETSNTRTPSEKEGSAKCRRTVCTVPGVSPVRP